MSVYCMECLHRKTGSEYLNYISREKQNVSYCHATNFKVLCTSRNTDGNCGYFRKIGSAPFNTKSDFRHVTRELRGLKPIPGRGGDRRSKEKCAKKEGL